MSNKIAAARRASKMTVEHAADLAGITAQTLVAREKNPGQWRLCELAGIYEGLDSTGKELFRSGINEIFLT
mgnify:CR=1 FL=1